MPKPGTMAGGAGLKKVPDEISTQREKPTAADAKPPVPKDRGPRPTDSAQKDVVPVGPEGKPAVPIQPNLPPEPPKATAPTSPKASHYQSSESDSSESSEEASITIIRPPQDFRYKYSRQKRQVSPNVRPEHIPEFLSVFPSTPSPFRSCPGAPRYTTVWTNASADLLCILGEELTLHELIFHCNFLAKSTTCQLNKNDANWSLSLLTLYQRSSVVVIVAVVV